MSKQRIRIILDTKVWQECDSSYMLNFHMMENSLIIALPAASAAADAIYLPLDYCVRSVVAGLVWHGGQSGHPISEGCAL